MNFKKYFQIASAFKFPSNDNDWKNVVCLKTRQILGKNQLSTWKHNFFLDESDFNLMFKDHIKEEYNLWLEDKILEVEVMEKPLWIVAKIPEKPNTTTVNNTKPESEEIDENLPF